jgi:hypothetical protein
MTIIDVIRKAVAWQVEPPPPVVSEPIAVPRVHPERALLRLLNAASFESLEVIPEARALHGLPAGGVDENYHVRRFSSMLEAGVALRIDTLADPEASEARRLSPLGRRYVLLRALRELQDVPVPENTLEPRERTVAEPEPAVVPAEASEVGHDANLRQLRARRLQAEADARDFQRAKFERRQEALVGRVVDITDTTAERVSLIVRLAEWSDKHPELAAELAAFGEA